MQVSDFSFPRPEVAPLYAAELSRLSEAPTMKYKVEEAPNFTAKLRDKTVPEFSHVRFMCSVTGLPAPRIIWKKDGKDITNNSNYFISVSSCLQLLEITEKQNKLNFSKLMFTIIRNRREAKNKILNKT